MDSSKFDLKQKSLINQKQLVKFGPVIYTIERKDTNTKKLIMKHPFFLFSLTCLVILSCGQAKTNSVADEKKTSPKKIDSVKHGIWYGNLPCADCNGILTVLRLNKNGLFEIQSLYSGKSNEIVRTIGHWQPIDNGKIIELKSQDDSDNVMYYQISQNQIKLLDREKNTIKGDHDERYVLQAETTGIKGYEWKLTTLRKREIKGNCNMSFSCFEDRISGKSFCNSYSGEIHIDSGNTLKIGPVVSTKMACQDLDEESDYFTSLEETHAYDLSEDTLILLDKNNDEISRLVR